MARARHPEPATEAAEFRWYHNLVSFERVNKHRRIIQAIYEGQANILWSDIEKMFIHQGAEVSEGRGSRVRVALNGVRAVFHRPHPQKETDRGAVASVRRFLTEAGINADDEDESL